MLRRRLYRVSFLFVLMVGAMVYGFIAEKRKLFPYKGVHYWSGILDKRIHRSSGASGPLNVVLIVMDALRADRLSLHGNPRKTSPYIDELALRSAVFDRAYSQAPWTPSSMASIFTGTYQSVHQLVSSPEDLAKREFGIVDPEMLTMAEMFKELGYTTAAISSQPWISPQTGFGQGFDEFHIIADLSDPHETDKVIRRGTDWIGSNRDRPFFLYLHVMNPHDPYEPPAPFDKVWWREEIPAKFLPTLRWRPREKFHFMTKVLAQPGPGHATSQDVAYLQAMYDSDITYTDWCVGMLARQLGDWGVLDNTLLVLTGDHGEAFLEHGAMGHGDNLYNEQIHVPLILHNARLFPRQRRVDAPVQTIDLFSTLANLLDFRRPGQLQGGDLLSDEQPGVAYTEGRGMKLLKLQTADWSLIADEQLKHFELYDLKTDPGEKTDVSASRPDIAHEMQQKLIARYGRNLENPYRATKTSGSVTETTIEQLKSLGYVE